MNDFTMANIDSVMGVAVVSTPGVDVVGNLKFFTLDFVGEDTHGVCDQGKAWRCASTGVF